MAPPWEELPVDDFSLAHSRGRPTGELKHLDQGPAIVKAVAV